MGGRGTGGFSGPGAPGAAGAVLQQKRKFGDITMKAAGVLLRLAIKGVVYYSILSVQPELRGILVAKGYVESTHVRGNVRQFKITEKGQSYLDLLRKQGVNIKQYKLVS